MLQKILILKKFLTKFIKMYFFLKKFISKYVFGVFLKMYFKYFFIGSKHVCLISKYF